MTETNVEPSPAARVYDYLGMVGTSLKRVESIKEVPNLRAGVENLLGAVSASVDLVWPDTPAGVNPYRESRLATLLKGAAVAVTDPYGLGSQPRTPEQQSALEEFKKYVQDL